MHSRGLEINNKNDKYSTFFCCSFDMRKECFASKMVHVWFGNTTLV